ncbi:MAG: Gfo/Idh/MocA family oxidoreductase [Lachnospiraceae bacterium]|nr:Gfo/Idh/MocA family oxidoreductase [Lachnospiraceae bacterium]
MEKIKVGIIGTGGMGNGHVQAYQALGDRVEVTAACDINGDKAKWYAEQYGIPHVYTDYNEMMAKEKLDCVSVTTWNAAHKGAAVAALRGGANVLCEKPLAMNAAEAEEMKRAAEENGKLLQVGFIRRFGRDADTIRSLTENGVMGDIYYAKANYLRRDGCPGGWFGDKAFSGGGPLIDLGVHVIDLSRYLAGNPKPVSAYGVTFSNLGCNRAAGGEKAWILPPDRQNYAYSVEDLASAMVTFENGFTLQVEASFNLNIPRDLKCIQLFGTKAGAKIEGNVELYSDMAGMFVNVQPQGSTSFDFDRSLKDEIRNFVDASQGLTACRATAEDGLMLMKILDAIYESARIGRSVDIR